MAPMSSYLNCRQAAEYLGLSYDHLRHLLSEGRGPKGRKYLGRWYFQEEDLDDWIERNSQVVIPENL